MNPTHVPDPLYSCSQEFCREECSYPADMLWWYATEKRWVCDNCWQQLPGIGEECDPPERGIRLDQWMKTLNKEMP